MPPVYFCEKYMGLYPVISMSLKNVEGMIFESACAAMKYAIGAEALRFSFLEKSPELSETDKKMYKALTMVSNIGDFQMSYSAMEKSLLTLSSLLCRHYGKKVILLIDEYDVPLDKAFQNSYYEEMVSLIRNMFGNVLKTNSNLYFAVLTGCLRIAKESIFTGLNNFEVLSVLDVQYDEYFGFTDTEVQDMLNYYDLSGHYTEVKEWYDGYQFGNTEVYCPWDVICYCKKLYADQRIYIYVGTEEADDTDKTLMAGNIKQAYIDSSLRYYHDVINKGWLWKILPFGFNLGLFTTKKHGPNIYQNAFVFWQKNGINRL